MKTIFRKLPLASLFLIERDNRDDVWYQKVGGKSALQYDEDMEPIGVKKIRVSSKEEVYPLTGDITVRSAESKYVDSAPLPTFVDSKVRRDWADKDGSDPLRKTDETRTWLKWSKRKENSRLFRAIQPHLRIRKGEKLSDIVTENGVATALTTNDVDLFIGFLRVQYNNVQVSGLLDTTTTGPFQDGTTISSPDWWFDIDFALSGEDADSEVRVRLTPASADEVEDDEDDEGERAGREALEDDTKETLAALARLLGDTITVKVGDSADGYPVGSKVGVEIDIKPRDVAKIARGIAEEYAGSVFERGNKEQVRYRIACDDLPCDVEFIVSKSTGKVNLLILEQDEDDEPMLGAMRKS